MKRIVPALLLLAAIVPCATLADTSSDEATIRALVDETWEKVAAKKYDGGEVHPRGAWQATSQGGLWRLVDGEAQKVMINDSPAQLDVAADHVDVTFLGSRKDVAYVTFYLTGTIRLPEGNTIPNYRTRVSWVLEKTDGKWLLSGAHYSPLFGGSGVRFE